MNMMNKIRERLSWDADCTILLVRFILAVVVVVCVVWYCRTHPYNGESEVLNSLIADATKSEGPPATVWETITVMVMGPLYFVLSVAVLLLPLVVFGLPVLAISVVMDWLDSRGSKNNRTDRSSEDARDENG
ncbi:hypothetical protein [Actinomyces oris]|uniref:hypothetical protein n=1 Tax=Actinomyces oris TaxID=544580 RepID=UPI00117F52B0|nr:hypothetical protein [Actinomyces oris]